MFDFSIEHHISQHLTLNNIYIFIFITNSSILLSSKENKIRKDLKQEMKYYLDQLCIEVTRKCNMSCAHCLRGEAQKIDIDTKYIDNLLQDVSGICNITFTGGEPSLNISAIEYTLQKCQELDIPVASFYIVTNGKSNILPLVTACLKWYAYCDDYEDMCGLALSKDMFHDEIDADNERILRGLSFFREDKFTNFDNVKIINQGRAEELGGFFKVNEEDRHEKFSFEDYDDDECRIESLIYLSANGDVKTDCDIAYENDEYTIGNVERDSLRYIIEIQKIEKTGVLPV